MGNEEGGISTDFQEIFETCNGMCVTVGGRTFCSSSSDKNLYGWDIESGEAIATFPVNRERMDLELKKYGKW